MAVGGEGVTQARLASLPLRKMGDFATMELEFAKRAWDTESPDEEVIDGPSRGLVRNYK